MDEENKKKEVEYIRSQKEKGVKDEDIKKALLGAGWGEDDIAVGFSEVEEKTSAETHEEEPEKEDTSVDTDPQPEPSNSKPSSEENVSTSQPTVENPKEDEQKSNNPAPSSQSESVSEEKHETSVGGKSSESTQKSVNKVSKSDSGKDYSVGMSARKSIHKERNNSNMAKYLLVAVIAIFILGAAASAAYFAIKTASEGNVPETEEGGVQENSPETEEGGVSEDGPEIEEEGNAEGL